eukprot:6195725-Pleurochrysis_carterae.AAC.2
MTVVRLSTLSSRPVARQRGPRKKLKFVYSQVRAVLPTATPKLFLVCLVKPFIKMLKEAQKCQEQHVILGIW